MKHLRKTFEASAHQLPARVGVALASIGTEPVSFGEWSHGVAWSTIKVPLAIAAARTGIAGAEQLSAAISRSDNAAAEQLWAQLGDTAAARVESVLRDAGDYNTIVESRRLRAEYTPFGQTRWSLADQARFAAGLTRVDGSGPVVDLMTILCAEHRWGLAAKGLAAKGGWGPGLDADYLVRQFAISGDTGIAVAADVDDGGYEAAVEVVNRLADWVVEKALPEY